MILPILLICFNNFPNNYCEQYLCPAIIYVTAIKIVYYVQRIGSFLCFQLMQTHFESLSHCYFLLKLLVINFDSMLIANHDSCQNLCDVYCKLLFPFCDRNSAKANTQCSPSVQHNWFSAEIYFQKPFDTCCCQVQGCKQVRSITCYL